MNMTFCKHIVILLLIGLSVSACARSPAPVRPPQRFPPAKIAILTPFLRNFPPEKLPIPPDAIFTQFVKTLEQDQRLTFKSIPFDPITEQHVYSQANAELSQLCYQHGFDGLFWGQLTRRIRDTVELKILLFSVMNQKVISFRESISFLKKDNGNALSHPIESLVSQLSPVLSAMAGKFESVEDVYAMAVQEEFYCDFNMDNNQLQSLASKLGIPETEVTQCLKQRAWDITLRDRLEEDEELGGLTTGKISYLEVTAQHRGGGQQFRLYLYPSPRKVTYQEAITFVTNLNQKRYAGFDDWRIPTLNELLGIFQYTPVQNIQGQFFPSTQLEFPDSGPIRIWSSAVSSPQTASHWVLTPQINDQFEVTFELADDSEDNNIILAVRPEAVPQPPPQQPQQLQQQAVLSVFKTQKGRSVAVLSFIDAQTHAPLSSDIADLLDHAVEQGIIAVGNKLTRKKDDASLADSHTMLISLSKIVYDPVLTVLKKIERIIQELIVPNSLDVLISGQYIIHNDTRQIKLFAIRKDQDNMVMTTDASFSQEDLFCSNLIGFEPTLCSDAQHTIASLIQKLLENL